MVQIARTHKSCVCFQHANSRSGRMFDRVLHVQSKWIPMFTLVDVQK